MGVVRPAELESATSWFVARCSIQLNYGRVLVVTYRDGNTVMNPINGLEQITPETFPTAKVGYTLPLSRGQYALIDLEDLERIQAVGKWSASWTRSGYYGISRTKRNGNLLLHRFIMDAPSELLVDHRDGNTLDCRKSNLRLATHTQNCFNRAKRVRGHSSRYKGVRAHHAKWQARIVQGGRQVSLGHFSTEELAAHAYDEAALRLHGDFARLNFARERAA